MMRLLLPLLVLVLNVACARAEVSGPFLEKPYLQLGKDPKGLELMWQASTPGTNWITKRLTQ